MSLDPQERQNRKPQMMSHHLDWSTDMLLKMGVESGFENFSHEYQKMRLFMDDLELNIEAKKQGVLGGKTRFGKKIEDVPYDPVALSRIKKIWYGQTWLVNVRDEYRPEKIRDSFLVYQKPESNYFIDVIPLPALMDMCPVGRIDDMTWGLRLDIAIPALYAFEGCSYEDIIMQGKYYHKYSDKTIPTLSRSDVRSKNVKVNYVGRVWWKKTVRLLETFWNKNYYVLFVNQHKMVEMQKRGVFSSEKKAYTPDVSTVE